MALRRLVTSAATIAMLGCSDAPDESALPPEFNGALPGDSALPSANIDPGAPAPGATTPEAPSNAGAEVPGQVPSEAQNPDIGIDTSQGTDAQSGDSQPPPDPGAEQPGAEEPGAPDPAAPEPPIEEPEPEGPPPIVRPPLDCGAPPPQLQNGIQGCQSEDQGSVGGQSWFLWYTGGNGCMTTFDTPSGAFNATWNSPGDFLARIGPWFDETETHQEIGEIGADLKFTREGSGGGFSYIGIYGWTVDPLVEFYIVEDAFGGPPRTFGATQPPPAGNGTISVDGGQYDIRTNQRFNQPSITGQNANFLQVFSVRQGARNCGHVSISEHFRQWESRGVTLGRMKEAKIVVEVGGGNSNGSITFSHANVSITPPN